ncbi:S49 family peptidase, partial [Halorubrum sp. ASP121]
MSSNRFDSPLTPRRQLVVVVVAAALIGAVFAPIVYANANEPSGTVAVVEIEGPVNTALANDVENELAEIRNNGSVEAVVLKMDTGGGAPVASERMYKAVQRTSQQ